MDRSDSAHTPASELGDADLLETVAVSASGDVTIPERVRDKLGLTPPGLVAFTESDTGDVVIEQVPSAAEMAGFAARNAAATTDTPATALLRELRDAEQRELE